MTAIQLITAATGTLMLWVAYTGFRRRELRVAEFGVWVAVWGGLVMVSLVGDRLRGIVQPLQIARLLDLVMVGAILVLASLVLHLNRQVRRYEERLATLVRELALEEAVDRSAGSPPSG